MSQVGGGVVVTVGAGVVVTVVAGVVVTVTAGVVVTVVGIAVQQWATLHSEYAQSVVGGRLL